LSQDPPGWYYVGKGLLRYKFGDFWTDRYKSIDPSEPTAPPADSRSSNPASLSTPPNARRSRPRASRLSIAVCAGLLGLGVGGGLLKPNIPHELVSWAAALKSQVSALLVGPAPPTSATTSDAKAQSKAKAKAKPSHAAPARSPTATPEPKVAKPPARPAHATPKVTINSPRTVATPGLPTPSAPKRHNPVAAQ
jgi:hypothetical protein